MSPRILQVVLNIIEENQKLYAGLAVKTGVILFYKNWEDVLGHGNSI
jgi:hypothetical protein